MKKIIIIVLILASLSGFSQSKYIKKIKNLYDSQKYENCIKKTDKYKKNVINNPELYYYKGFSYFKLYEKSKGKDKYLKNCVREIKYALRKDKNRKIIKKFDAESKVLHDTLKNQANFLYSIKKIRGKSKVLYKNLAELFNDTTEQYIQFFVDDKNRPDIEIVRLMRQGKLNQTDKEGLKQGPWKKVYQNGATAYEVTFKDNKPVGEMKRYHENGRLAVLLNFDEKGKYATAEIYDEEANLISKGFYAGKEKDSIWLYFDKGKNIIKKEIYKKGKLNGKQIDYHKNGNVYALKIFTNGVENGKRMTYYDSGKTEIELFVINDKIEGKYTDFYQNGDVKTKGQYKNDLRVGNWYEYDKKGNKKKVKYIKGKPENWKEIEDKRTQELLEQMQKKGKYIDPAKYKTNPDEYLKQVKENEK